MYRARVLRLLDYGAMVELAPPDSLRTLLHISEVSPQRVRSIEDALKVRGAAGGVWACGLVASVQAPGCTESRGGGVCCLCFLSAQRPGDLPCPAHPSPPPLCLPAPQVGQELELLCVGRDAKGQVRLSRKALLARQQQGAAQAAAAERVAQGGGLDADK